jgi:putative hydrolase of the HAD superfamily
MNGFDHIQAVTFDVGGTLIEPWPSVGHVYAEVAARHGVTGLPVEVLNRQFAAAWDSRAEFNYSRSEWGEVVDAAFSGLTELQPSGSFFSEVYDRFSEPGTWHVFDDVLPTLDELASQGIKLGVISNWDERLRTLLRRLGFYDYFDTVVVSCNVGFPKPSPVIFEHAADKLALPVGAILHVGDSLDLDVQGARTAGMEARLLRRRVEALGPGEIGSLRELC